MTNVYLQKITTKDNNQWCGCCGLNVPTNTEMIRIQTKDGCRLIRKDHLFHWLADEKATVMQFQYPKTDQSEKKESKNVFERKAEELQKYKRIDEIIFNDDGSPHKSGDEEVTKEPQVGLCKKCGRSQNCWFSSADKEQCNKVIVLRDEERQCLLEKGHSGYCSWWKQPCKAILLGG